ncbi:hypothetical protein PENTCL1PPCAC_29929 [Pristionchus entomophagus]|uniref:Essential protein Yae1 N-terminal domain-containing protein n=1 Tax=Pristionchus entomophagus TaxID=358040 RepID=A0AAV5UP39_9BILA|nr:hypothetical protein PENTCL1PPCAC_29929 [Pristionchus entomophagus]
MKLALLLCLIGLVAGAFAQDEDFDVPAEASPEVDADFDDLAEHADITPEDHADAASEDEEHADVDGDVADEAEHDDEAALDGDEQDLNEHSDVAVAESAASAADVAPAVSVKPEEKKTLVPYAPFYPSKFGHFAPLRRFGCRCAIKRAFHLGFTKGHATGYAKGFEDGQKKGEFIGFGKGKKVGFDEGVKVGTVKGFAAGKIVGRKTGRREGVVIGKKAGIKIGVKKGLEAGKQKGIQIGYLKGFEAGLKKGRTGCACKLNALKAKMIRRCHRHAFHPHY